MENTNSFPFIFTVLFSLVLLASSCNKKNENTSLVLDEEEIENEILPSRIKYDDFPGFYHTSEIAHYIDSIATDEEEKAWMLYCWITDNISYDTRALITGNGGDLQATTVFQTKKAICVGFSNLFKSIGEEMGLEILEIPGFSKGHDYKESSPTYKSNHIWNAVKINGKWKLVDATWGQGFLKEKDGRTINYKQFSDFWFATEPYQFLFTHFPENPDYQFMEEPISNEVFRNTPRIEAGFFQRGLVNKRNYKKIFNLNKDDLVVNYTNGDTIIINSAPLLSGLENEEIHHFNIVNNNAKKMAIINNEEWIPMEEKETGEFVFTGMLDKGTAVVAVNNNDYNKYDYILEYKVD